MNNIIDSKHTNTFIMEQHQDLFTFYIQRSIRENRSTLSKTEPFYQEIMDGGRLLWKKYFLC